MYIFINHIIINKDRLNNFIVNLNEISNLLFQLISLFLSNFPYKQKNIPKITHNIPIIYFFVIIFFFKIFSTINVTIDPILLAIRGPSINGVLPIK